MGGRSDVVGVRISAESARDRKAKRCFYAL